MPLSLGRNDRACPPFRDSLIPGLRSAPIYLSVPNVAGLPFASENGRNARPFSSKTMHGKDYETETWRSSGCRFVLEPPIDLRVRFTEPSNHTKADGKAAAHVPPNSRLCRICRARKPLFANELGEESRTERLIFIVLRILFPTLTHCPCPPFPSGQTGEQAGGKAIRRTSM